MEVKPMQRIYTMFAYIVEDERDNSEGIPAFFAPGFETAMPMVGADEKRMKSLLPMAKKIARESGRTVRLFRFQVREMLEEIKP